MKLATVSLFGLAVAMSDFRFAYGDQCASLEADVEAAQAGVETANSDVETARQAVVDAEHELDARTEALASAQQEVLQAGCRGWTPTVGQTWVRKASVRHISCVGIFEHHNEITTIRLRR